jgi:hypothetical protein
MNLNVYIPSREQAKYFLVKLTVISLGYFLVAYIGIFLQPYIKLPEFFELAAISIAAVVAVRYGWLGVLGAILGSAFYHLMSMPWQISLALALSAGLAAFLFNYIFKLLHPPIIVINQVSAVATFAFVVTPLVCAVHAVCMALILQNFSLITWDGIAQRALMWWFNELLIANTAIATFIIFISKSVFFYTREG